MLGVEDSSDDTLSLMHAFDAHLTGGLEHDRAARHVQILLRIGGADAEVAVGQRQQLTRFLHVKAKMYEINLRTELPARG